MLFKKPTFDLITPSNEAAIISLQNVVEELKAQSYPHWNWLICTNGSSEQMRQFVDSQDDPRIRLIEAPYQQINNILQLLENCWFRRDFCIKLSGSGYLIMLDSDIKILQDDYLEKLKKSVKKNPSAALFVYNIYHLGVKKILPVLPIEYGCIDHSNYCVKTSFARETGYPCEIDWPAIKRGETEFQHKDFIFFNKLFKANHNSFIHLDDYPLLEWNGNAAYRNITSRHDELQKAIADFKTD